MPVVSVNDQSFEQEVLRSELPVLVDLYADWCQPCKQIAPIVEEISNELAGKLKCVKVDTDKNPRIAQAFRVQSIPMLLVLYQGQVVQQQIGAVDKPALMKMIEAVLPRSESEVKPAELAQLIIDQRVLPIDIRDASSYGRYRIPTAKNIPLDELQARAGELAPTDGRLRVLYGRSQDEAKDWAQKLGAKGAQVGFLAGGFLHWEAEGFDVERG